MHAAMFIKALDQMGKVDAPKFGDISPDATVSVLRFQPGLSVLHKID
jgi:hypothetical protein